jgi:hypothetical protein
MASLKCGSCRKVAMPSADPPVPFLALRGTACITGNETKESYCEYELEKEQSNTK